MEGFLVLVLGLIFGSFANVCIYRMPRNMSVVKPSSHCTNCNNFIKWYDNIPVLSYIILRGKCRNCGSKISFIYPSIELICGLLFLSMFFLFGFSYMLFPFCLLMFSLLVITAIDFEFQIIPDEFSFMLMIVGIVTSFFNFMLVLNIIPKAEYGKKINLSVKPSTLLVNFFPLTPFTTQLVCFV